MLRDLRKRVSRARSSLLQRKPLAAGSKSAGSGRLRFEMLEPRLVLDAGPLVISEFMAVNNLTLADVDGDFSDWRKGANKLSKEGQSSR